MNNRTYKFPIIRGHQNAEHLGGSFDPGSVLRCNSELIKQKRQVLDSLMKPSADQLKEIASLMVYGNREQKAELASARIDRINIMILENIFGADFFEVVELADNEIPHLIIERDQRWEAMQIGQHGGGV